MERGRPEKAVAEEGSSRKGTASPGSRRRGRSLPQSLRKKHSLAHTLISVLWPPGGERITFYCFRPPSVWSFVTAAPGHLYKTPFDFFDSLRGEEAQTPVNLLIFPAWRVSYASQWGEGV